MAYTSCAATIAANIARDCAAPLVGGYTGRGVLIDLSDHPSITHSSSNPRVISAITLASGKKTVVLDNAYVVPNPLNGSNTASNTDDGMMKFLKTLAFGVPARGAEASKKIIEPTYQSPLGYLAVLEKSDRTNDGAFEVIGIEQGLKANPDGITRDEWQNGGATMVTMSCKEQFFEYIFGSQDYDEDLAAFEALIAASY